MHQTLGFSSAGHNPLASGPGRAAGETHLPVLFAQIKL